MKLINYYNRYMLAVMITIFIASGAVSYLSIKQILMEELDEKLLRERDRIQTYVNHYQELPVVTPFNDEKITIKVIDKTAAELFFATIVKQKINSNKKDILREFRFPVEVNGITYSISVISELEGTKHIIRLVYITTSLTILMMIITILLLNRGIVRKMWSPFYKTLEEIKNFQVNKTLTPNFPETKIVEFILMADILNIATNNAVENYRILKEFTENASHEIQTPLAIVQSKLDLLLQHNGLNDKEIDALNSAYGAIKKLSLLNKDLLLITMLDNNQFDKRELVYLLPILKSKILEFKELWEIKGIKTSVNLHQSEMKISKELIEILINNVLSNATKHNYPSGSIEINLYQNQLIVTNTGINYPLDEKLIFTRFYKADNHTDNNGLGLSIVKQICDNILIKTSYQFVNEMHSFTFSW